MKTIKTVVKTMASTINMRRPMESVVYLLKIRATISVPPVVPPALKIIPNPVPRITPDPIQARRMSPFKSRKRLHFEDDDFQESARRWPSKKRPKEFQSN